MGPWDLGTLEPWDRSHDCGNPEWTVSAPLKALLGMYEQPSGA